MREVRTPTLVQCIAAFLLAGIAVAPFAPIPAGADGPSSLIIHSIATVGFPQIRLYMTARDAAGRLVQPAADGLTINDSGQFAPISGVQAADRPVALVLLLDSSGRNGDGWLPPVGAESGFEFLKRTSASFLDSFSEGHLVQVIGYDKTEDGLLHLERDVRRIRERLTAIEVQEETWLYERIDRALDLLRVAESERRVLVVASDGNDVHSLALDAGTIKTLSDKANAHQINIHTIGAGRLVRDQWLRILATETRGSFQQPSTLQLGHAFEAVRDALRSQFIVTYVAPCTGRPHTVIATSPSPGGGRDSREYSFGEAGPRIQLDGAQTAGDIHHVTLSVGSICPLQEESVRLVLGGGRSVAPVLRNGDNYFFSFNPVSLGLDAGPHMASVVANNGIEARLEQAYELRVARTPDLLGVPVSALPFFLLSGGVVFLGGAGLLLRESRKPRAIDAFLEYSPEPGEPEVWRPGASFWLRSVTRIGRSGDADIEVPPSVTDIPWPGVRLDGREGRGGLYFKVTNEGERRGLNVWVGHNPLSSENDILRPGETLFVGGLGFTLRTRLKTGAAAATTGSY